MTKSIWCAALLVALASPATAQMRMTQRQIGPGAHLISGFGNGNVLAIEGTTGVLLVDAQSSERAAAADTVLRSVTHRPVQVVINTHYHADHTGGNAYWRERGARIIAHTDVRTQALKDTTIVERSWRRTPLPAAALPTELFDTTIALPFGGETVYVYFQDAHTGGDGIVWLPSRNVLHAGDILEVGSLPQADFWAGGSLIGMLDAVDFMLGVVNDSTAIVPGHGPVINRAVLRSYRMQLALAAAACATTEPGPAVHLCRPAHLPAARLVRKADVATPDAIITALYQVVSGPRWQPRDWSRFRSLFAPTGRLATTHPNRRPGARIVSSTPDEFIATNAPFMVATGFKEREIGRAAQSFGSQYHAFSTYEFQLTRPDGRAGEVGRGINSIQLQYDGARWWITSLLWDNETEATPIPDKFLGPGSPGQ